MLADITRMLVEIIGEDYLEDVSIDLETAFRADLDVESIEFIALGEMLQERYPRVDFAQWIATLEVDDIIALTVGELVGHIQACQQ